MLKRSKMASKMGDEGQIGKNPVSEKDLATVVNYDNEQKCGEKSHTTIKQKRQE